MSINRNLIVIRFFVWFVESGSLIVPFGSLITLEHIILNPNLNFIGQLQVRQLLANVSNPTISVLDRKFFCDESFRSVCIFFSCSFPTLIFLFRINTCCYWIHPTWNCCELDHRKFVFGYCPIQCRFESCQYHGFGYTRTENWHVRLRCWDFIIDQNF
jgi:hypothetical protein